MSTKGMVSSFFLLVCSFVGFPKPADALPYSFRVPDQWGALTPERAECCPHLGYPGNKTAKLTRLPNLLGLGVQKSGSTQLSWFMAKHPKFARAVSKETHFLDRDYTEKDLAIYNKKWNPANAETKTRFEFTPTYIWLPFSACRVKKVFPEMKLVVILRDPVDRAYSEFNMVRSRCHGDDTRCIWRHTDYLNVIKEGVQGLSSSNCTFNKGDGRKTWNDCFRCLGYNSKARDVCHNRPFQFRGVNRKTSCFPFGEQMVSRGLYAAQLAWWFSFFSPENFVIVFSHDFYKDPIHYLNRIGKLAGVKQKFTEEMLPNSGPRKRNRGKYEYTDIHKEAAKRLLIKFFARPNLELYQLLNSTNHKDYTPFLSTVSPSTTTLDMSNVRNQSLIISVYRRKISVSSSVLQTPFGTYKGSGMNIYSFLASVVLAVVMWQVLIYLRALQDD